MDKVSKPLFLVTGIILIGVSFFIVSPQSVQIEVFNQPNFSSAPESLSFLLSDKIKVGLNLLANSPSLEYETATYKTKTGKTIKSDEIIRKQIALAVLDMNTGEIFEKRVWAEGNEIENRNVDLQADNPAEKLIIKAKYWNSFNTFYEIENFSNYVVIGNKYLLANKYLSDLPEKNKKEPFTEILYVPYSTGLHHAELIKTGHDYLRAKINAAVSDLTEKKVASLSDQNQLAAAVVSKEFIANIALIEHIDPDLFAIASDGGRELMERVLIILGSNKERAYRYTGSPAGANGLAQFIKPTYEMVTDKYPSAGLLKSYSLGMADHANAIKAMVLFFDLHKKELADKISRKNFSRELGVTEEMLAAAYNGGPSRVISSVNKFGSAWMSQQLKLPEKERSFRQETIEYLKKFWFVRTMN
jgi:hypothetical protein